MLPNVLRKKLAAVIFNLLSLAMEKCTAEDHQNNKDKQEASDHTDGNNNLCFQSLWGHCRWNRVSWY